MVLVNASYVPRTDMIQIGNIYGYLSANCNGYSEIEVTNLDDCFVTGNWCGTY